MPFGIGGYFYFSVHTKGTVALPGGTITIAQQNNSLPQKAPLPNTGIEGTPSATANDGKNLFNLKQQDVPATVQAENKNEVTEIFSEKTTQGNNTNDEKPSPSISFNDNVKIGKDINQNNDVVENAATALLLNSSSRFLDNSNATGKTDLTAVNNDKDSSATKSNRTVAKNADSSALAKSKKKTVSPHAKQQFLYAGLLGGVDASTVKLQSIKGAGYSLGLLAGYRFSKRWSAEAGILWDEKKYYTDGKYFNTSKIDIPTGLQLQDLNGTCNMFDISVDAKYDLAIKRSGHFFVTGGFSSYLMKKEAYNYSAIYYGQWLTDYKSYSNATRDWFSIAQFSVGYEKQLGKKYNLRIEPYLKMPLQGVGIGSLPITSMGLNIGLTRSFH